MATSLSPVSNVARERFAPPALVAGLAIGIVLTLALLFDPQSFLQRIERSRTPAVDLYFARAIAHTAHDAGLWLLVARRQLESGHYRGALKTLRPLLARSSPPQVRERARWLYVTDMLAVTYAYPAGSLGRAQGKAILTALIARLTPTARGPAVIALAQAALAIQEGQQAVALYVQAAHRDHRRRSGFFALAAQAAVGAHRYREGARLAFEAAAAAATPAGKIADFLMALRILESDNQPALALRMAHRHLAGLGRDPQVLRALIALARRANRPETAAYYANRLLRM